MDQKLRHKSQPSLTTVFFNLGKKNANLSFKNGYFSTIFWSLFCQLDKYLPKNWSSDVHFEALSASKGLIMCSKKILAVESHDLCQTDKILIIGSSLVKLSSLVNICFLKNFCSPRPKLSAKWNLSNLNPLRLVNFIIQKKVNICLSFSG